MKIHRCLRCGKRRVVQTHYLPEYMPNGDWWGDDSQNICAECSKKEEIYILDKTYEIKGNRFVKIAS